MNQLIESVLAVRPWFAPNNRSCLIFCDSAIACDVLAVRFHVALLHVCCKAAQVLVIWQQGLRLRSVEVIIPDADKCKDDWKVVFELGLLEVNVHLMRAGQELMEVVVANVNGDAQSDRRPERISSTDPVEEFEHVRFIDSKGCDLLGIGRQSHKVLRNVLLL